MEITVMKPTTVWITEAHAESIIVKHLRDTYYNYLDTLDEEEIAAFKKVYKYFSGGELDTGEG